MLKRSLPRYRVSYGLTETRTKSLRLNNNPMNNLTALDLLAANAGPAPEWFTPQISLSHIYEIEKLQKMKLDELNLNSSFPINLTDFGIAIKEKIENRERQLQWPYYYAKSVLAYRPITIPDDIAK